MAGGGIGRRARIGGDFPADDRQRVIDFLARLRSIIDRKFEDRLASPRRLDDATHMLGWKNGRRLQIHLAVLRLYQRDRNRILPALRAPIDGIDRPFIEKILRFELVGFARTVLPGIRPQVAEAHPAFTVVEFGNLSEFQLVAFADIA